MVVMSWKLSVYATKLGPTYMCDDYDQGSAYLKWQHIAMRT